MAGGLLISIPKPSRLNHLQFSNHLDFRLLSQSCSFCVWAVLFWHTILQKSDEVLLTMGGPVGLADCDL